MTNNHEHRQIRHTDVVTLNRRNKAPVTINNQIIPYKKEVKY